MNSDQNKLTFIDALQIVFSDAPIKFVLACNVCSDWGKNSIEPREVSVIRKAIGNKFREIKDMNFWWVIGKFKIKFNN